MRSYSRADRVSMKIQQAITRLLLRKMGDPRMEMATVSDVKLSPDLRLASVYVTVFGNDTRVAETLEGFRKSKGFIKKQIAGELGLRYMPDLRFFHDATFDRAARLDQLIASVAPDSAEPAGEDSDAP